MKKLQTFRLCGILLGISLLFPGEAFAKNRKEADKAEQEVMQQTEPEEPVSEDAEDFCVDDGELLEELLKTAYTENIHLQHYMEGSMKQGDYASLSRGGCCAMAYSVGLSIVMKQNVNPTQFFYGGLAHYDWGHAGPYVGYDSKAVYEALRSGNPSMFHYYYQNRAGEHWVLIMGILEGVDVEGIAYGDFLAIDPATGQECALTSVYNFYESGVDGIRIME